MQKIKLMNIVIDPNIHVREVEPYTVSQYAEAMRSGAEFPPLLLEAKTNRCVCGNHRYTAYRRAFSPEHEVPVIFKTFKNEAEIIREAARDNSSHGRPLDTWDKKRVAARLRGYGDSPGDIATLLAVSVKKIETWAGLQVVILGKRKQKIYKPVKSCLEHKAGQVISATAYEDHAKQDIGRSIAQEASMIIRHIEAGLIDTENEKTMTLLQELYEALGGFLSPKAKSA